MTGNNKKSIPEKHTKSLHHILLYHIIFYTNYGPGLRIGMKMPSMLSLGSVEVVKLCNFTNVAVVCIQQGPQWQSLLSCFNKPSVQIISLSLSLNLIVYS